MIESEDGNLNEIELQQVVEQSVVPSTTISSQAADTTGDSSDEIDADISRLEEEALSQSSDEGQADHSFKKNGGFDSGDDEEDSRKNG